MRHRRNNMSLKQAEGLSMQGAITIIIPLMKTEMKKQLAITPVNSCPILIVYFGMLVSNVKKSVTELPKANNVTPATLSLIRKSLATTFKAGQKLKCRPNLRHNCLVSYTYNSSEILAIIAKKNMLMIIKMLM